jgi:hypothetical protein
MGKGEYNGNNLSLPKHGSPVLRGRTHNEMAILKDLIFARRAEISEKENFKLYANSCFNKNMKNVSGSLKMVSKIGRDKYIRNSNLVIVH